MGKDVLTTGTRNIFRIPILNYMVTKVLFVVLLSTISSEEEGWLVDAEAINHMTYCSNDFTNSTTPRQTHITNVNEVSYPIAGVDTIELSSFNFLSNFDILTKEIIEHGTKRGGGLYYMDDFNSSKINNV
ncbi:hypothetical protein CR513_04177, partial [Mucuna pruriens]